MGKGTLYIGTYLQGSLRKYGGSRTPEHKGISDINGTNSDTSNIEIHESEYQNNPQQ